MKSFLNALHQGRLIELPDTAKEKALEYLALLIEAIPDIGAKPDLVGEILAHEKAANTGLGMGVACPHLRVDAEGELLCAVGWSPAGIDYGAPDGQKVHLVIMYYIPNSQRNAYLKEISSLAKAIHESRGIVALSAAADLQEVRSHLLDWATVALDAALPDAKARMIQLKARAEVTAALAAPAAAALRTALLIPFTAIVPAQGAPLLLSQDGSVMENLEKAPGLREALSAGADFELGGYRILVRSSTTFAGGRFLHECLAVKQPPAPSAGIA